MLKEKSQHEATIASYEKEARTLDDAVAATELAEESGDESFRAEAAASVEHAAAGLRKLELARMLWKNLRVLLPFLSKACLYIAREFARARSVCAAYECLASMKFGGNRRRISIPRQ